MSATLNTGFVADSCTYILSDSLSNLKFCFVEAGGLTMLDALELANNQLTGTIPAGAHWACSSVCVYAFQSSGYSYLILLSISFYKLYVSFWSVQQQSF